MSESIPVMAIDKAERAFVREVGDAAHTVTDPESPDLEPLVLLPTGVANRQVFVVGELVDSTELASGEGAWRGRLVDSTGHLIVHLGRFTSSTIHPPLANETAQTFVAVVGAPRTTRTPGGTAYVSMFPKHVKRVDEERVHEWMSETVQRTLERIEMRQDGATEEAIVARERYGDAVGTYREGVDRARECLAVLDE